MPDSSILTALAHSFISGEMTVDGLVARGTATLGREWQWLRPLATRYVEKFSRKTRPRRRDVIVFLLQDPTFSRIWLERPNKLSIAKRLTGEPKMHPSGPAVTWNVPPIVSVCGLADWLRIDVAELQWFADLKGLATRKTHTPLNHYKYVIRTKPCGSLRLIEAPKSRLKLIQRQILRDILERVPAHPAAHGFVKGRSIKSFVAPHVGRRVVLRMDLKDFFPSFRAARVQSFFRTVGYPEPVSDLLGGICTTATPRGVWKNSRLNASLDELQQARRLYSRPHLPQGAPTSPAIANLLSYHLDCRLAGFARHVGASYTRYADDIAFSGDEEFAKGVSRFSTHVAAILREEGFILNHRKTRVMRHSVRQHLAGIVANQRINVVRRDFDRLKAILTNSVRSGPEAQNRDSRPQFRAHLDGRISFVEMVNPSRGARLRKIFEKITWR